MLPYINITAEGLKAFLVTSYKEIEDKIDEGTTNRSIAATNMNETSSRAHTIVVLNITQKSKNAVGQEIAKTSSINLVDLAGRYSNAFISLNFILVFLCSYFSILISSSSY